MHQRGRAGFVGTSPALLTTVGLLTGCSGMGSSKGGGDTVAAADGGVHLGEITCANPPKGGLVVASVMVANNGKELDGPIGLMVDGKAVPDTKDSLPAIGSDGKSGKVVFEGVTLKAAGSGSAIIVTAKGNKIASGRGAYMTEAHACVVSQTPGE